MGGKVSRLSRMPLIFVSNRSSRLNAVRRQRMRSLTYPQALRLMLPGMPMERQSFLTLPGMPVGSRSHFVLMDRRFQVWKLTLSMVNW